MVDQSAEKKADSTAA
jgi:hypothetical protein